MLTCGLARVCADVEVLRVFFFLFRGGSLESITGHPFDFASDLLLPQLFILISNVRTGIVDARLIHAELWQTLEVLVSVVKFRVDFLSD